MALRVRLFGELDLRDGDERLSSPESARAGSLLAYLVVHRRSAVSREQLAFALWPDSTEAQARTNLRHVLHILRRALPDADRLIDAGPRTLRWHPTVPCDVDVVAFEDGVTRGDPSGLQDAVEQYTGDLLEGCSDEWLVQERERLRLVCAETLEQLIRWCEAGGSTDQAIAYAERLIRHDPLHETTYRTLMRLYDARGDRARALRVYHACVATLRRELGVDPAAPTRAAYEALLAVEQTSEDGMAASSSLLGRAAERSLLAKRWRATESGAASVVLVTGEPGIGKSRLVEQFRLWCAHRGAMTAVAQAYPEEGRLPYGAVVSWLRTSAVKSRILRLDRARLTEIARLLPELLAEVPGLAPPELLPPREQRQRLFDAVATVLSPSGRPLLLVAEDMQWWDAESLQLLGHLLHTGRDAPLLVTGTCRWEELDGQDPLTTLVASLQVTEQVVELPLRRLSADEVARLGAELTGAPLADEVRERLFRESEGIPLFVVEGIRAGASSPKLQAVIASRLGRLSPPAGRLAEVAAAIGRQFTVDVLTAASDLDPDTLVAALDELWRRRILDERGTAEYAFSHEKIREVTYQRLAPARRRRCHLSIAHALRTTHAEGADRVSGQIAMHYDRAGAVAEAIEWYERAARVAQQLHLNAEAVRVLRRALDLLGAQPDSVRRRTRELELCTALMPPLAAVEGWASPALGELHRQALALGGTVGVEPSAPVLRSLAVARLVADDFAGARLLGGRLRERGERDGDDMLVVEGEYVHGIAAFWQADFVEARRHFEVAVARYRGENRTVHLLRYGIDPKVVCLGRLGNTMWFLGDPEAAVRYSEAAMSFAEEIGHPDSHATALVFTGILAVDMDDIPRLRACTRGLSERIGSQMRPTQVITAALRAYVDVLDGDVAGGLASLERLSVDDAAREHAPGLRASVMRVLLAACIAGDDPRTGRATAERLLAMGGGAPVWVPVARRFLDAVGTATERSRNAGS